MCVYVCMCMLTDADDIVQQLLAPVLLLDR
jgi:hypothetical protein